MDDDPSDQPEETNPDARCPLDDHQQHLAHIGPDLKRPSVATD